MLNGLRRVLDWRASFGAQPSPQYCHT